MTTHYMEEAANLCDQICIIDKGKIIANDTVEGVIDQANLSFQISFHINEDISGRLATELKGAHAIRYHDGVLSIEAKDEMVVKDLIFYLHQQDIPFRKISIKQPELEDAYIKLTGKRWGGE